VKADLLTTEIRTEEDLVLVRQRARQIAELLNFSAQDQNASPPPSPRWRAMPSSTRQADGRASVSRGRRPRRLSSA